MKTLTNLCPTYYLLFWLPAADLFFNDEIIANKTWYIQKHKMHNKTSFSYYMTQMTHKSPGVG